ncbi:hypothetical protein EJ04DRAFT_476285 [Polyplosphaeria fusca]|uniref:Uncharacterized protein n=1 Tax=Polyplosphaeria fusca TaxID=682080 RepID=A0A9P4QPD7_9PLEO|nr:hypothetical protein EJ04DRAFT_476285 [Polyplosphaeria fusca]
MNMALHDWSIVLNYVHSLGLYFVFFCSSFWDHGKSFQDAKRRNVVPKVIWLLQSALALLFLTSAILVTPSVKSSLSRTNTNSSAESSLFCFAVGFLYFAAGLLPDPQLPFSPSTSHFHAWIYTAFAETVLLILGHPATGSTLRIVQYAFRCARILTLTSMCALYSYQFYEKLPRGDDSDEEESLLQNESNSNGYGAANGNPVPEKPKAQSTDAKGGWISYFIGFSILFPYLWPSESRKKQLTLGLCVLLMLSQRGVNILVPYQISVLVEAMGVGKMPWKELVLYVFYRSLQGQQGVIGSLRAILWIPARQDLFRRLTCAAFEHVLSLSHEFHLSKRIGEVLSALNKGSALNTFLDSFAFELFPMVFDLGVAAVYFFFRFDALYSLVLLTVMWSYIYATIYMAQWRAKARRQMAMKDREMDAARMETMLSYDTVHYSSTADTEAGRFSSHVSAFQHAERSVLLSLNFLNITQNFILSLGVLLFTILSVYQVSVSVQSIAVFVSILSYYAQLQAPLQFFGSFYNQVQNNLIDAERMLDLFKIKPTITDSPHAREMPSCRGHITFNNVSFSYGNGKRAISNVSFTVPPNTSTAIVGESGSGKSTCLKLLFRFYDISSGSIQIDGEDIRDLKLLSYRRHFGVVPQDTTLFNMSIMANLQYVRPDADEEEIYDACRAASIHDRILAFPEGYETKVGERGLRLSGGEKQRIAIARAILKDPQMILLDEATSSLDARTEEQIQGALDRATRGRTTVTIAHRLSTITKCDQILVLHEGKVVEKGTHESLLAEGGRYSKMWEKQTTAAKTAPSDES